MGQILQVVSGIYLVLIWLGVSFAVFGPERSSSIYGGEGGDFFAVIIGVGLSIPAVALYAFGQLVEDTRRSRDTLSEMLRLLRDGR